MDGYTEKDYARNVNEDFANFLLWHMTGDYFDAIPWERKSIRDFVLEKSEDLYQKDVLVKWYYFKRNPISGVSKFTTKELKDLNNCKKYQTDLRNLISKYQGSEFKPSTLAFDFE